MSLRYLSPIHEREEGGSPGLVGEVRMGLVLHLKHSIGMQFGCVCLFVCLSVLSGLPFIEREEGRIAAHVMSRLSAIPQVVLLGRQKDESLEGYHLPIFSFLVRCGSRFLHFNFVCALLNDLFGLQSRGCLVIILQ